MKKESPQKNSDDKSILRFNLLIAFFCGLLVLAHFASSFFPHARLWGINHLAYFPMWVRLVFTFAGLIILVPRVNEKVYEVLDKLLSLLQKIFAKREVLGYAFFSLLFTFLFWLLRTRANFIFGDSYSLLYQLKLGAYVRIELEPLTALAHLYLYKLLNPLISLSPEHVYVVLSLLAGGVFVFLLFFFVRLFSEEIIDRLVIFSLFLFSGATQLLLGYVEHYSLSLVSIFAYLYFSLRYLQGKARWYLPVILCALSIAFHFSSLYLLPSLLFLLIIKKKKNQMIFNLKRIFLYFLILALLTAVSVFYVWFFNPVIMEIFVPLSRGTPDAPGYTLFSSGHLLDFLNQHFLLSSAGLILLFALALNYRRVIKFRSPVIVFLLLVIAGQLSYHFLIDPKLGAARDWDLFSSVALGYIALGIYLFAGVVKYKRYAGMVLTFTAILSTLPWFLLNADMDRAIPRFKNILDLDLKRSRPGRLILTEYYNKQERFKEAEGIKAEFFRIFPEDSLTSEAQRSLNSGKYEEAKPLLKRAIEVNPAYFIAHYDLARVYLKEGEMDKAIEEFKEVVRLKPFAPVYHLNLGRALLEKGSLKEALSELKTAIRMGGDQYADAYCGIAYIHYQSGETKKAAKAYEQALKIDPSLYQAHFGLGQLHLESDFLEEAIAEFEKTAEFNPDYAPAYYQLGLAYSRKGLKEKAIKSFESFLNYSPDESQKEEVREWLKVLRSQNP